MCETDWSHISEQDFDALLEQSVPPPPEQIVRLGVVVVFPPEAVAVQLLRQCPRAGVVRIGYQRPCLAYLYRRGKSGNAIREVVRCGGISAAVRK